MAFDRGVRFGATLATSDGWLQKLLAAWEALVSIFIAYQSGIW